MRRRGCPRCRRSGLGRADVADGRGCPGDRVRTRPGLHRRRFHARPRPRGARPRGAAEPSRGAGRGHRGAPPVEPERERAGARAAHEAGIEHDLRWRCVHQHRRSSARADRGHRHQRRGSAQVESGGRCPRGRDRGDAEARLYRRGLRHRRRGAPARRCRRQFRLWRPSAGVERGCPRRRDARARAVCGRRPAVYRRVVHTRERRAARASGGGRHGDRTDAQAGRPPAVAGYVARRDAVGSVRRRVGRRRSRRGICAGGGRCAPLDRGSRRRRPRAGAAAADPVRRRLLPKLLSG